MDVDGPSSREERVVTLIFILTGQNMKKGLAMLIMSSG